jgi:predicted ribosome quality control (RQC) complex YloA/Tae2 family protein
MQNEIKEMKKIKKTMERLECLYMLKELKLVIGKRFKKAYMLSTNEIKLSFQDISIIITPGKRVNVLTKERNDYIENWFIKKLRKELENKKVIDVYLLNNDRVFVFEFEEHLLIIPVYKENVILLNKKTEEKTTLTKEEVIAENHDINELIEKYKEKPIASVIVRFVGKSYMPLIVEKLGIDEKKPCSYYLSENIGQKIDKALQDLLNELKPCNDEIFLKKQCLNEAKSLSEVLDNYYVIEQKNENKIQKAIEIQKESIKDYKEKAFLYRKIGEWIFKNAHVVDEMIEKIKKGKDKEIKGEINKADKSVTIEIELENENLQ